MKGPCFQCRKDVELDWQFKNFCLECLREMKKDFNSRSVCRSEDFFPSRPYKPYEMKKVLNQRQDI